MIIFKFYLTQFVFSLQFYPCALQDYNRGRAYLSDMASREGVPEFENIEDATECAIQEIQKLSPLH